MAGERRRSAAVCTSWRREVACAVVTARQSGPEDALLKCIKEGKLFVPSASSKTEKRFHGFTASRSLNGRERERYARTYQRVAPTNATTLRRRAATSSAQGGLQH